MCCTQSDLGLDRARVEAFVSAVEERYDRRNPYHNSVHAADVVQGSWLFLRAAARSVEFPRLEVGVLRFRALPIVLAVFEKRSFLSNSPDRMLRSLNYLHLPCAAPVWISCLTIASEHVVILDPAPTLACSPSLGPSMAGPDSALPMKLLSRCIPSRSSARWQPLYPVLNCLLSPKWLL